MPNIDNPFFTEEEPDFNSGPKPKRKSRPKVIAPEANFYCTQCESPIHYGQSDCINCREKFEWDNLAYKTGFPAVDNWSTSLMFSILGLIAGTLFFNAAGALGIFGGVLVSAAVIFYVSFVYPSYFKEDPVLSSNEVISFANLFFGGIIFGSLWNRSLANKQIGISHIVYIALMAAVFIITILAVIFLQL